MGKIYIIANWKMQLGSKESASLAGKVKKAVLAKPEGKAEVILCPTFTSIPGVYKKIKGSPVKLGAQNVFYHESGQYTGEVSAKNLVENNVEYVILGHSERRKYLHETDEDVNRKLKVSLENGLKPILCIGETLEDRRENRSDLTVIRQITRCLEDVKLKEGSELIIAYEPVWAISPAPPALPADAEHSARVIQHLLPDFFSQEEIKRVHLIYGGSVDASNLKSFLIPGLLEGALVGGASLSSKKFIPLISQLA